METIHNENQSEGENETWIPPDLPGLIFPIAPNDSLSEVSLVLNVADTIHLSKFEALLSDEMLCISESDDSITMSNDRQVVERQGLGTKTISSEKLNTNDGKKDRESKTRNDNNLTLRILSQKVNYNELSENDGDFSATEGSDYVSNSDDDNRPFKFKKYNKTKPKKCKVSLIKRINERLSDIDKEKPTTSNELSVNQEVTPNTPSYFQTSNANILVPETPESSFENTTEQATSYEVQTAHAVSSDTLDGLLTVSDKLDTEDIHIPTAQATSGKRSWNRRNCCFYCESLVTNFTRHLIRNHQDEPEVLKLMAITDSDPKTQKKKRRAITDELRNRGNYIHNSKVVTNNDGHLITVRRANDDQESRSPSTFVICRICLGTFKRSTFYRHSKKCEGAEANSNRFLARNALNIIPDLKNASKELRTTILPRLRNDEISLIAKNDPLIINYGCRLLKKKKERRSRKVICSKMRDLAHLLKTLREKNPEILQLQQIFDPKYYDHFIEAVKKMSGFNEETGYVKVISVPARLRPEILGCIEILLTQTIMDSDKSSALKDLIKTKLNEFKLLLEANWQWEISSNAEKTRKQNLMTTEKVMPVDEDIEKVIKKIHDLEKSYYENLKKDVTVVNYENLCEVTIAHIILLDRKRSGDVAESELQYYLNRKVEEIPLQVLETLDVKQKEALSELDIFQIPGKRGRPVPVLLTKTMKRNIDILIASRSVLKISSNNKYLFARPLTEEPFDGGKCLNRIKAMCSLRKPEMLTSTGLRHHIATMSQVHPKTDDKYTQQLATFLGHDMQVHSSNYRLPLQAIQKGLIGSRLLEVEQVSINHNDSSTKHKADNDYKYTTHESDKENSNEQEITEKNKNKKQNAKDDIKNESIESGKLKTAKNEKRNLRKKDNKIIKPTESEQQETEKNNKHYLRKRTYTKNETNKSKKQEYEKNKKQDLRKKVRKNIITDDYEAVEKYDDEDAEIKRHTTSRKIILTTDDESDEEVETKKHKNYRKKKITSDEESAEDEEVKRSKTSHKYNMTTDEESDVEIRVKRRKTNRNRWTDEEIVAVMRHLKKFIAMKKNPGKSVCEQVLRKEPVLHKRSWMQINSYINNIYKKNLHN